MCEIKRKLAIIFLIFIFASVFSPTKVEAEILKCPICGEQHDTSEINVGLYKAAYKMEVYIYKNMGGSLTSEDADNILSLDTGKGAFASLWSAMGSIYDAMKIVGEALIIVFFGTALFDLYSSDMLNAESFVKHLIKFVVSVLIIENGFQFATIALDMANVIYQAVSSGTQGSQLEGFACCFDAAVDGSKLNAIGTFFKFSIPFVCACASFVLIRIFCYLRLIDLFVKIIFSPVGLADIGFKGTSGSGWRFFKSMIASAIQGTVMIAILFIQNALMGKANFFVSLAIIAATITALKTTEQISREVIGA